jgi:hypothetical protein
VQKVQKWFPLSTTPPKKDTKHNRIPPRRKAHASDTTAVIRTFLFAATETISTVLVPRLHFYKELPAAPGNRSDRKVPTTCLYRRPLVFLMRRQSRCLRQTENLFFERNEQ